MKKSDKQVLMNEIRKEIIKRKKEFWVSYRYYIKILNIQEYAFSLFINWKCWIRTDRLMILKELLKK